MDTSQLRQLVWSLPARQPVTDESSAMPPTRAAGAWSCAGQPKLLAVDIRLITPVNEVARSCRLP